MTKHSFAKRMMVSVLAIKYAQLDEQTAAGVEEQDPEEE